MFSPSELTGAQVRQFRLAHKLSVTALYARCGFTGKSTARLMNIETKDSWKPGDRERVASVLNDITRGVSMPVTISRPAPVSPAPTTPATPTPATPTGVIDVSPIDDDDVDDDCVQLAFVEPRQSRIDLPLLSVMTNGQLQTFKRCRRKWWLAWYRKLTPLNESLTGARAIGTRVHRALQAWYVPHGHPRVDPRDALERVITQDRTTLVASAQRRGHDEFVVANLTAEFGKVTDLERAMVEGYVQWLAETGADADLEVVAPETVISVGVDVPRLRGTVTPVILKGLLDVRVVRTTDDARLFIDHKTVGDLTSPVRTLHQSEQMLHYHLIEWLALSGTDERCDGALYNMLRKVKRTARATPPFYQRVEVRHNDYELESYRTHTLATIDQVLTATEYLDAEPGADPNFIAYPTRTSNCAFDCDFFAVCSMFDDGSRAEDALASLFEVCDPMDRYEPQLTNEEQ